MMHRCDIRRCICVDRASLTTGLFVLLGAACCCDCRVQIKWGSGSGQQSVTGFEGTDDPNSLWQIKEGISKTSVAAVPGTVVRCGDVIRLQHASTKRWLHSHLHQSPLTHRQEISGYGEDGGVGSDTGDNWKVECYGNGVQEWNRDTPVAFLHVDTGKRLYTRRQDAFDNNNCRGCPIVGQLEISAHNTGAQDANALWIAEDVLPDAPDPSQDAYARVETGSAAHSIRLYAMRRERGKVCGRDIGKRCN